MEELKPLIAFLVKLERSSLMDHDPKELIEETNLVDKLGDEYYLTLDEEQTKRYNTYVEFYKLNEPQGNTTMQDDEKVEGAAEVAAPAEEAKAE